MPAPLVLVAVMDGRFAQYTYIYSGLDNSLTSCSRTLLNCDLYSLLILAINIFEGDVEFELHGSLQTLGFLLSCVRVVKKRHEILGWNYLLC